MDSYFQIYMSYVAYATSIGSPILSFEEWMGVRTKLDKRETVSQKIRDKWLDEQAGESPRSTPGEVRGNDR